MNPKKSNFVVREGKNLGFIVSKDGMIIDPERTESIAKIGLPSSKKAMQYFLGKTNFVRKFVPNFAQIVRLVQYLIKKDVLFKWYDIQKDVFIKIRKCIMDALALMFAYFDKDFILYAFSTDFSYYDHVLTQKHA